MDSLALVLALVLVLVLPSVHVLGLEMCGAGGSPFPGLSWQWAKRVVLGICSRRRWWT